MRDSGLGEDHARTLAKRLPFAMKNHLDRRLLPRPLAVRLFNAHVYAQRTLEAAAVRIQMDWRRSLAERHVSTSPEKSLSIYPPTSDLKLKVAISFCLFVVEATIGVKSHAFLGK